MAFTKREMNLGLGTLAAVLIGLGYMFIEPRIDAWKDASDDKEKLVKILDALERRHNGKPKVLADLNALMEELPSHPLNKNVTAESLIQIQNLANKANLELKGLDPSKEKKIGDLDLFELSITCDYEGSLEAIIVFLYSLQAQGAVLDIKHFTVAPQSRSRGRLKGKFIVDCAYSRKANTEVTQRNNP